MRRFLFALLACAAGLVSASRAAVAVMDFNSIPGSPPISVNSPYVEDGIQFEAMYANNTLISFTVMNGARNVRTGFGAGTINYRISLPDGRPFAMNSIRMAPVPGVPGNTTFTGRKADNSTVTQTFSHGTDNAGTVRTFPATFQGLVALEWSTASASSTHAIIDDFTVALPAEIKVSPSHTVTESSGSTTVGVTLSEPLATPLSLTWLRTGGSAAATVDFSFPGPPGTVGSTVSIPAGQTSWSLITTLINDTAVEPLEDIVITFSTTNTNAVFAGGATTTTVRIASEDGVTGFPGWMSAHGLTANDALPNADPNGDGVSNLESWLCKINPAGPSPQTWLDRRATFFIDAAARPSLRFTVPTPLPSDVRIIFEETTALSSWSEQARRTGWAVGSLWTGPGSARVSDVNNTTHRTITCGGSLTTRQRSRAWFRMRYEYVSGGGSS
jgi:hypothetical protein